MTDVEKLRNDLSTYGARLGVVEPCFHRVMWAYQAIAEVYEALRDEKRDGASYAFPSRYGELK